MSPRDAADDIGRSASQQSGRGRRCWEACRSALFAPVDIASLVVFRIAFGLLLAWEFARYARHGWIHDYFVAPGFHFSYFGFDWVQIWPPEWMPFHFALLGACALAIACGFCYGLCTLLFCAAFTHMFLMEQAIYLNHFYLISLLSGLLFFVPAHRMLSVDAWLRPGIRTPYVPAWTVWLLRFQIAIPYFFGGVAKINGDWLHGEPMRTWLRARTDFPMVGTLFLEEWVVYLTSYSGMLIDLLVVPLLLWRRTRLWAFLMAVTFHLLNAKLFSIGVFPWLMIAATTLFLPPSWPRFGNRMGQCDDRLRNEVPSRTTIRRVGLALAGLYIVVQTLVPLRHWLYPGNPSWTGEGDRFAWRMKLTERQGRANFVVRDPASGEQFVIDPDDYLSPRQHNEMCGRPDMILQFSKLLAREYEGRGHRGAEVYANAWLSLNGRPYQRLIDPALNLAGVRRSLTHAPWILAHDQSGQSAQTVQNRMSIESPAL